MIRKFFKRIFGNILTNLGNLEGDYRVAHLRDDVTQSLLYVFIICLNVFFMLRVDAILFKDNQHLFMLMLIGRSGYVLVTILFGVAISKTNRVKFYDRLVFSWIFLTILSLLLFNFTRPANYLSTSFDIIIPFALYLLSPLKFKYTFALAVSFSLGTIYVDHFFKPSVDPILLNVATSAQGMVQLLGCISALQLQTYRRKSFKAFIDEKDAREMAAYLANIDPLTKSHTRGYFLNIAESEFLRFKRYQRALSVMVIDADNFKLVNDTHGHHGGDLTLKSLAFVVLEHKRAQDVLGRLGGEEFGVLLPETGLEQAKVVAERIQKIWEKSPVILDGELIRSTISIGVAEAVPGDTTLDDLLRRADKLMYKAKEYGRNQVVVE